MEWRGVVEGLRVPWRSGVMAGFSGWSGRQPRRPVEHHLKPVAPEAWPRARKIAARVLRPLERFVQVEASSGIVLITAAAIALIWANSPWASVYEHILHTPITLGVGARTFARPLHFWVNDG